MNSINIVIALCLMVIVTVHGGQPLDASLKIHDLSKCKYQIEAIGCYKDDYHDRLFPDQIINSRDTSSSVYHAPLIQWRNYNRWLANFICECATMFFQKKKVNHGYIGLQFYAECWSQLEGKQKRKDIKRHGKLTSCINGDYKPYSPNHKRCQVYMGQASSNFVYKISKRPNEENNCPYYTKRGCFKDYTPRSTPNMKPLQIYAMNERDDTIANWNGRLINWKKWGKGYLTGLLCRCAKKAKSMNKRFFGIQFFGECWVGDDEHTIAKDGDAESCVDKKLKHTCTEKSEDTSNLCLAKPCAGQGLTNMVYEVHQGPLGCMNNPCKNGKHCVPNGMTKYDCVKRKMSKSKKSKKSKSKKSKKSKSMKKKMSKPY